MCNEVRFSSISVVLVCNCQTVPCFSELCCHCYYVQFYCYCTEFFLAKWIEVNWRFMGSGRLKTRDWKTRDRNCMGGNSWKGVHWRRNCFADRTTTHTIGNSSIDTSLIRWHLLRPWSFVETCVVMKFVDDDDDDDKWTGKNYFIRCCSIINWSNYFDFLNF